MDKLKKVIISGYKSVSPKYPVEIEFGDITVLLGANGSGKSNIISFFKMLNYMMDGRFQLFVEKAGTGQVFLHNGSKCTTQIDGKLEFEGDRGMNRYKFQLAFAIPDRLIITSEEIIWGDRNLQTLSLPSDYKESALIREQGKDVDKTIQTVRVPLMRCKVYQFHDSASGSRIRLSSPVDSSDYLQSEGGNPASFLYTLKKNHPSAYDRIVRHIRQIMPQFKDFYLEPNESGYVMLKWIDISLNDYILLPEQFSDGTIRFIALATLLLQPPQRMPGVIIIDEPELGLHPYAISQLAEMIKDASGHTQVIVATQSPGLVDEFEANQITVIERDDEKECTTAHKLDREELKDWLENYSLSELWDKNVIGGRP
ncbi:MAG: AAA family ATPase [Tannerella sp.]|nr:AAA family ATPase [Tannerella sp.]